MNATRYDAVVGPGGKVELTLPLPMGTPVQVIVKDGDLDDFRDLMDAAHSSIGFWDNPMDDEDWNDAAPR
jgi:hypothetical protein